MKNNERERERQRVDAQGAAGVLCVCVFMCTKLCEIDAEKGVVGEEGEKLYK